MTRILVMMIVLAFSLPALADRDKGKEGNDDCAHEANKRDLTGKERKRFMKECKERRHEGREEGRHRDGDEGRDRHGDRRESRDANRPTTSPAQPPAAPTPAQPAVTQTPTTAPAVTQTPAAAPAVTQPPATAPAVTPPGQPAPKPAQPAATAAKPAPKPHTRPGSNERIQQCRSDPHYKEQKTKEDAQAFLNKCTLAP
jgi:hypothetical protein